MSTELYLAFVVTVIVLVMVPGPVVAISVAHSLSHGWRRALLTVAGASASIVVQLTITSIGLTSFLLVLAEWFEVLRWICVAFLIYLGVRQWLAKPEAVAQDGRATSSRSLFGQGFLVSSTNPKSLAFYGALFPYFIEPSHAPVPQLALLSITFLVIFSSGVTLYVLLAHQANRLFRDRRSALIRNRVVGSLFIGAGVGLALVRRN